MFDRACWSERLNSLRNLFKKGRFAEAISLAIMMNQDVHFSLDSDLQTIAYSVYKNLDEKYFRTINILNYVCKKRQYFSLADMAYCKG